MFAEDVTESAQSQKNQSVNSSQVVCGTGHNGAVHGTITSEGPQEVIFPKTSYFLTNYAGI